MRVVFAVNAVPHAPQAQMTHLASARYRGFIPAGQMQKDGQRAEVTTVIDLFRPDFDTRLDLLVLHQPKHDILLLANVISVLLDKLDKIRSEGGRVVIDVSDFKFTAEFQEAMAKALGPDKAQAYRVILDAIFARCDAVTAPTGALAELLRTALRNARPVFVIEDVVEVARQPAKFAPGPELRLLWFGFLSAHIAALKQLVHDDLPKIRATTPCQLHLVCEKLPTAESRQVFGEADPATFGVTHAAWSVPVLEAALAACDLVALPFDAGSMMSKGKSNNRALQALAAGRYVVAHPLESYRTLGDFIGLDASIATAVATALADPAATLQRIQAGQDFVEARYSPAAIAARWLDVARELQAARR
ncbi:MAG: glycosyltransferase [Ferrovibrio sp.]|uniref:glycosyltransferase n=1 Tax=Ferrovibrio sp. TaxID=1917215 RepID=UPI00262BBE70|nr:glycosyltransferase [Ferrovibrio sp.]MCW0235404.1 glycosyltransferase [Ferrovibrio sp.]